jgi:uncharacterized protein YbjT (DUF2867 family)
MGAFVAGATGYVGSAVVELLRERGIETIAHIRPESSKLEEYRERFSELGADVDTTPWDEEKLRETLADAQPDLVFCCIGTTRKRKRQSDNPEEHTYEAVDYGLTKMLVDACVDAMITPRFVYISSAGTSEGSPSSYIQARWKAEQAIKGSGLPYTIARPSIIAGDREEGRPAEEIGAKIGDFFLNVAGAVGFDEFRDRYRSLTGDELAAALVAAATTDEYENTTIDGVILQELAA